MVDYVSETPGDWFAVNHEGTPLCEPTTWVNAHLEGKQYESHTNNCYYVRRMAWIDKSRSILADVGIEEKVERLKIISELMVEQINEVVEALQKEVA